MFVCFFFLQCLGLSEQDLKEREVDHVDIAYNEVPEKHYKMEEVMNFISSLWKPYAQKTGAFIELPEINFILEGVGELTEFPVE